MHFNYASWGKIVCATAVILLASISKTYASDWDSRVSSYIDAYEKSAGRTKPIVYPALAERVKNVFLSNKNNHIIIMIQQNSQSKKQMELFYTKGELHILAYGGSWNMFTKGEFVYEWKNGDTTGIKIRKNEGNLVDYILYLTDPSYIMTGIYFSYIKHPEIFDISDKKSSQWKEIFFKKPINGFQGILVNVKPFWFYGFKMVRGNFKYSMNISKPVEYQELPKELLEKMRKIKFTDSKLTVLRHMTYL